MSANSGGLASSSARAPEANRAWIWLITASVGALFYYKWGGAFRALSRVRKTGELGVAAGFVTGGGPWTASLHYLQAIAPALGVGMAIGAVIHSAVPARGIARILGRGERDGVSGAVAGAPLMLCSCCVTPIFTGVYQRGARLGSALSFMLASPGLNPAAIALTFGLFPAKVGAARLAGATVLVVFVAPAIGAWGERGRAAPSGSSGEPISEGPVRAWRRLGSGFERIVLGTFPLIFLGVIGSALILSCGGRISTLGSWTAVLAAALASTFVALPTFYELALASLLFATGAPLGAVVALVIAGPIVNLPSLFVLAREASARVAMVVAIAVFTVAASMGWLVELLR